MLALAVATQHVVAGETPCDRCISLCHCLLGGECRADSNQQKPSVEQLSQKAILRVSGPAASCRRVFAVQEALAAEAAALVSSRHDSIHEPLLHSEGNLPPTASRDLVRTISLRRRCDPAEEFILGVHLSATVQLAAEPRIRVRCLAQRLSRLLPVLNDSPLSFDDASDGVCWCRAGLT